MVLGDTVLYASFATGAAAILLLIANQFLRKSDADADTSVGRAANFFLDVDVPFKWLVRAFSVLLLFDLALLTSYFVKTDLTINYVWTFSSKSLPMVYKLSGVLAGQQGTLLFWALFIGLSSLWLSERRESTDFMKKTQILVLVLGLFFVGLTLQDSPFKTIYQAYPDVPTSYLPPDGNGLNPLLIDPWMAVHPPVIFIAYALMAVPFALAVVYLFTSLGDVSKKVHGEWIKDVVMWCRVSWIFLTLGIAIGGFWAYKVLGWGGFWAWDPVETSSLVPWFLLTGALHALTEHRKDRSKYNILTPLLIALSFTLVLYATLVTRSGFFESVHAFDAGTTGRYILYMTGISAVVPLALAIINGLRGGEEQEGKEEITLVNRTNIFYIAIVLFIIFTFVSFWGITYPAISRLMTGIKVGVGPAFYNVWTYPVIIAAMLLAGLALNYKPATKDTSVKEFLWFTVMTVVAGFIKLSGDWNLMEYSPAKGLGSAQPALYSTVGSISILSFIPPTIYLIYNSVERFRGRRSSPKKDYVAKELGISIIHIGVALIVLGSVFSYAFDSEFPVSLNPREKDKLVPISGTPYGVKLLDYETLYEYQDVGAETSYQGLSVTEFYNAIHAGSVEDTYTVHGDVKEVINTQHNTYVRLGEGQEELWAATSLAEIPVGSQIALMGFIQFNFASPSLNKTFPLLFLAQNFETYSGEELFSTTQQVKIAVYKNEKEIGRGTAKSITYFNGDVQKVMIDRGIEGDVYAILNGFSGGRISLDLRIKPLVNLVWIGVIFFVFGMIAILRFSAAPKRRE